MRYKSTRNSQLRLEASQVIAQGISEEGGLYISQILQKARLIFDEDGTQAAASTVVSVAPSAYNPDLPVEFNMNRPFVAVIADAESGAVCFAAVVNNPLG